jgi:ribose/xylose/arabinose/galactoside ABC-type transport system permease subunit
VEAAGVTDASPVSSHNDLESDLTSAERARFDKQQWFTYLRPQELGLIIAIFILAVFFSLQSPLFISFRNVGNILEQSTFLATLAVGMTMVIISGQFDLSIGSMYGFSAIIFATLLQDHVPLWISFVLSLTAGALLGLANGLLTIVLTVPAIIITLGTLSIYRGAAWWLSDGFPVSNFDQSSAFFAFGQRHFIPWPIGLHWVPDLVLVPVVVGTVGHLLLSRTALGHRLYGVGSNRKAASLAGVRVGRIQVTALVLMGFLSALAGMLGVAQSGAADPNGGVGFELDVIAGVIIGGAAIQGGRGTIGASILGILLIGEVRNGLIIIGVNLYGQIIVSGILVILAVAVDKFITRRAREGRKLKIVARKIVARWPLHELRGRVPPRKTTNAGEAQ